MKSRVQFWAKVVMILLIVACTKAFFPTEPHNQFVPPSQYQSEYNWTWENCGSKVVSSPKISYKDIHFYITDVDGGSTTFYDATRTPVWGLTSIKNGDMFLTDWSSHINWIVRHEMLHAQIGQNGHPQIFTDCKLMPENHPDTDSSGKYNPADYITF